jgi:hypothetical protein
MPRLISVLLFTLWVFSSGCERTTFRRAPVYPVTGQLFIRGQPAANAHIELQSLSDIQLNRLRPHADVQPDGTFSLTTYDTDDGAPAGTYALTVSWPAPPKRRFDPQGPDRLNARFADPRRPLRTVTVAQEQDLGRIDIQ